MEGFINEFRYGPIYTTIEIKYFSVFFIVLAIIASIVRNFYFFHNLVKSVNKKHISFTG